MSSLSEYFGPVVGRLPLELVPARSLERVRAVASELPGALSRNLFGCESPLAGPAACDFLCCVNADAGRHDLEESLSKTIGADSQSVWARVRDLATAWSEPGSSLSAIDNVWLEFDLAGETAASLALPSVFFRPPAVASLATSRQALALLCATAPDPALDVTLARCFEALPPGAAVFQVGAMIARPTQAVRVCIEDLDHAEIFPYLDRIGWPGPRDRLTALLEGAARLASGLRFHVDAGSTVGPRLGLELYARNEDGGWAPILESLVAEGACTDERAAALLTYGGCVAEEDTPELWPSALTRAGRYIAGRSTMLCVRDVHHVKVTIEAGAPLAAKAYLGMSYRWFEPAVAQVKRERGMRAARPKRLAARARQLGLEMLTSLARRSCGERLGLVRHAPPPDPAAGYGDLVPLGYILRGLQAFPVDENSDAERARRAVEEKLKRARQGLLWSYDSDGLVTAIDSALILQGLFDVDGVEALDAFADAQGGYRPQKCGSHGDESTMRATSGNRHWCGVDYPTTCLVRGLRRRARLMERTPLSWIEAAFAERAGLFFANPYLVDWALASALGGEPGPAAEQLRQRLAADILASAEPDGSFGRWDVALQTSCAVLALVEAGYPAPKGALERIAAETLAGFPVCTPFHATLAIEADQLTAERQLQAALGVRDQQVMALGSHRFAVVWYRDPHRLVATSVAALALERGSAAESTVPAPKVTKTHSHPRYLCPDEFDYVRRFALPPYLPGGALAREELPS